MIAVCATTVASAERYRPRQRSHAASSCAAAGRGRDRATPSRHQSTSCSSAPIVASTCSARAFARRSGRSLSVWMRTDSRSTSVGWSPLDVEDVGQRVCRGSRPVSPSQIAWTWARTRSSLARSICGGATCPETIRCGPAEEVLVVAVPARANVYTNAGCPLRPARPAALRVVRRRWRDVAEVDDVERGDVDAELHRRRAEQQRQRAGAEPLFALLTLLGRDLGRVLAGLDPLPAVDDRSVELDEKRVRAAASSGGACGTRIGSWNARLPSPASQSSCAACSR